MRNLLTCLFCIVARTIFGQITESLPAAGSIANTSTADAHLWSAFHNPAAIASTTSLSGELFYHSRFQINELASKGGQVLLPTQYVNIGAAFSYTGYSLYHEVLAGIGFARNFSDKFLLGVQFNYYTAYFTETNRYRGMLLAQIGLLVHLSPKIDIGFNTFNPFQSRLKTEYTEKRIASVYSMGAAYYFAPELASRIQVDRELNGSYWLSAGFEYTILERITVKLGGYGSGYFVPAIGVGIKYGKFTAGVNGEMHPLLGLNFSGRLGYSFK